MKVALYARVSSDKQRERHTIASQMDAIRQLAVERGYEVCEPYVCVDDGHSGYTLVLCPTNNWTLNRGRVKMMNAFNTAPAYVESR